MISIRLQDGFLIYVLVTLGVLVWFCLREVFWRSRARQWTISEEQLAHCEQCRFTFIAPRGETRVRCPRCKKPFPLRRR